MWSKLLLCRFRQSGKNPLLPVPQGFAGFCPNSSWIGSTHSQSRRATNCATPGYWVFYPAGRILPNHPRYQLRYTRLWSFCRFKRHMSVALPLSWLIYYTLTLQKVQSFFPRGFLIAPLFPSAAQPCCTYPPRATYSIPSIPRKLPLLGILVCDNMDIQLIWNTSLGMESEVR